MLDLAQFGTIAGLAIITGIVIQVLKGTLSAAWLNFLPWLAIALAIVFSLVDAVAVSQLATPELAQHALIGIAGGLTAVGAYEALKNKSARSSTF